MWTLIEAPHHGWTDAVTLGGFAAAAAVLGAFIVWERHSDHPMLDLGFFADRRFSVGTGSITLVMFAMFGSLFVLTQLLQFVFGYTALEAGIRMLPIAGTMMVVAPLQRQAGGAARHEARRGHRHGDRRRRAGAHQRPVTRPTATAPWPSPWSCSPWAWRW